MFPYIYGFYKECVFLDVLQTARLLSKAYFYLFTLAKNPNRNFLFIGTASFSKKLISLAAKSCGSFFINTSLTKGFLTNWSILRQRRYLFHFLDYLLPFLGEGNSNKQNLFKNNETYFLIQQRYRSLKLELEGLQGMLSLPRYIIMLDPLYDHYLFLQCFLLQRRFIGLANGSFNPELFDIPIPANNVSPTSVKFVLEILSTAIFRAKLNRLKQCFTRKYLFHFYLFFSTYQQLSSLVLLNWCFYLKTHNFSKL